MSPTHPLTTNGSDISSRLVQNQSVFSTVNTSKPSLSDWYDDETFLVDRIREEPLPNPPLPDGNSTFSACLLIMDDNHRLIEWIAYHYHVLPLRYLIVAVDPRSETTPTMVLNRWRKMGIYILEWTDSDIWKDTEDDKDEDMDDPDVDERDRLANLHTERQSDFYSVCANRAKRDNRTWVTFHDTDEYIVYAQKGGKYFQEWENEAQRLHKKSKYRRRKRLQPTKTPPTTAEAGALLPFMREEAAAGVPFFNQSCIVVPRLLFGGRDDLDWIEQQRQERFVENGKEDIVSQVIDPFRLDTLRYHMHANRQDFQQNGLGKSMVDVSKIANMDYGFGIHRTVDECPGTRQDYWNSGLTVQHYLGSWEAYSFRNDSRRGGKRTIEAWRFKSEDEMDQTGDIITPWIEGFIQNVGVNKAKDLLQGAGLPRGFQNPSTLANWSTMFLKEILEADNPDRFQLFVRKMYTTKEVKNLTK